MPAKIDLTGQTINKIQVLEEAPKRGRKIYWKCKCFCGNVFEVDGTSLRSGHTKSCGCLGGGKKNEIGNKYGHLTVIAEDKDKKDKKGNVYWICKCDCGKEISVRGSHLRSGNTKSCGCAPRKKIIEYNKTNNAKDITGQNFGLLTALYPTEERKQKSIVWVCKCQCGQETRVSSRDLISGNTKSCGCQRYKSFGERKIKQLLIENNIPFIQEYSFKDLIFQDTKALARFDFFVDNTYLIEFDGIQHFVEGTGNFDNKEKFAITQEHDKIKNLYCLKNNIILIRIPYYELNNIKIEDLIPKTSKYIIK